MVVFIAVAVLVAVEPLNEFMIFFLLKREKKNVGRFVKRKNVTNFLRKILSIMLYNTVDCLGKRTR